MSVDIIVCVKEKQKEEDTEEDPDEESPALLTEENQGEEGSTLIFIKCEDKSSLESENSLCVEKIEETMKTLHHVKKNSKQEQNIQHWSEGDQKQRDLWAAEKAATNKYLDQNLAKEGALHIAEKEATVVRATMRHC